MPLTQILFSVANFFAVVSAGLVISQKKVIYSALFLVLHFFSLSLLFLLLQAPFVALAQVLIYAGAIMILFLFVIMLIGPSPDLLPVNRFIKFFLIFFMLLFISFLGRGIFFKMNLFSFYPVLSPDFGSISKIGELLFTRYVLFFELVSILLLVAVVGVVVLGKKPREGEE